MQEVRLREEICALGRSIFERGLTHGSTGNISARCADGWLLTPTGASLGRLEPGRLSKLDWSGKLLSGQDQFPVLDLDGLCIRLQGFLCLQSVCNIPEIDDERVHFRNV